MRPSIRFEVFRRDSFTCTYCGRKPPLVVLEVDHIVPASSGGGDELENLTTACWDCNHGKGAKHLDAELRPTVARERAEEIQERALQAKAYAEAVQAQREAEEEQFDVINQRWADAFGATKTEAGWRMGCCGPPWPNEHTVRTFLKRLPIDEILNAIDIAAASRCSRKQADRYFYAVCWRRIRGESES